MKKTIFTTALLIIAASVVLGSWSCSQKSYSGEMETISMGIGSGIGDLPSLIADQQNYFVKNGITVTFKQYDNGLAATQGMINGEANVSAASDFVAVGNIIAGQKISIAAIYSKSDLVLLIARRDRGIEKVSDLAGKIIGVNKGTIAEFYLGRFLELQGMNIKDVNLVTLKLPQMEDSLKSGDVDAVIFGEPSYQTVQHLGSQAIYWPAQSGQMTYSTLVGKSDWISQHPEALERFLRSLSQAEDYIAKNQVIVKAFAQNRLNVDDAYMSTIWPKYQYSLSLDQSLVVALQDETRWLIKNNLTPEKDVPLFNNYIYTDALKAVKPEAVNIIK